VKTFIFSEKADERRTSKNVIFETLDFSGNLPQQILERLHRHEIQSVIIEGGRHTLQTFIDEDLWDEARVFTGNATFEQGTKAPEFTGKFMSEHRILTDNLMIYRND
jgi:diaminohydroxyphosphoribosylaminopyrimidine deaminase/5-amino-6-(5-phosphoribosylamino)uracil reductase